MPRGPKCSWSGDLEGIGETLKISALPAGKTLSEIARTVAELVLDPGLKKEVSDQSWRYAQRYCYANQAKKHLLIEKALAAGIDLPSLDSEQTVNEGPLYMGRNLRVPADWTDPT